MTYDPNLEIKYRGRGINPVNGRKQTTPAYNFDEDVVDFIAELAYAIGVPFGDWFILQSSPHGQAPWKVVKKIGFTFKNLTRGTMADVNRGFMVVIKAGDL